MKLMQFVPVFWLVILFALSSPVFSQRIAPHQPIFVDRDLEPQIDLLHGAMYGARSGIITSNTGGNPFEGLEVNEHIGADRFYDAGYTGERAIVVNIEAGHLWNQHETLQHVADFFDARQTYINNGVGFSQLGEPDRHAVWCGQAVGGMTAANLPYQRGVAYGAEFWSGAIATTYIGDPFTTAFSWSRGYALTDAYSIPTLQGIGGSVADVVSSSWGSYSETSPTIQGGSDIFSLAVDGIAKQSGIPFVFCAGNTGPQTNTIWSPGNATNVICVGSLTSDTSDPPYSGIATFSSRGPQRYRGPDGDFGLVRARIDIIAPGTNLTLAFYGGTTGGNQGGTDPTGGATDRYNENLAGCSFATPIVAGVCGLLVDVAKDRFPGNDNARNGQVIKAVLLNAADKPSGWTNGQTGSIPITTTQALGFVSGAGKLNAAKAFDNFTMGETDVPGTSGSDIYSTGWDFGVVNENDENTYIMKQDLQAGSTFTATLNWFVGREWISTAEPSGLINATDDYYTDLALELHRVENGQLVELIAQSNAQYINTEHFSFEIPDTDRYALKVRWHGERYDFVGNSQQTYGLAWAGTGIPLIGDVNRDGFVNLLDVDPFVILLQDSQYQVEADINQDGFVNLLDVEPFVDLLAGN